MIRDTVATIINCLISVRFCDDLSQTPHTRPKRQNVHTNQNSKPSKLSVTRRIGDWVNKIYMLLGVVSVTTLCCFPGIFLCYFDIQTSVSRGCIYV